MSTVRSVSGNIVSFLWALRFVVTILLLFSLALFVGAARADNVPFLSAFSSKDFNNRDPLVGGGEAIYFIQPAGRLQVVSLSYNDGQWLQTTIYSEACDCSDAYWRSYDGNRVNSGSIQLLRVYDRGLQRDRALLFGRDEQGNWRVTEPFSELVEYSIDFLHNAGNLVFILASEYSEAGGNDELRVLLLDSGQWTSLELEEFPAELASLVSLPYQYCCMSGDPDNFVLKTTRDTRLLHFDRRESAGWQVATVELPIRVVENTRAGNDWIALKGNVLMVVEPFKDGELPDQGEVSLYHLGADGQWTLEASIAGIETSPVPAAFLMREDLALVQKRIYQRVQPGMWQPVAGINTGQQILNAFVRDDLLFWSASADRLKRMDIASWGAAPACENINANGTGVFGNSACTLLPGTPAVQPRSRLLPLSYAGRGTPLVADGARESEPEAVSFLNISGTYYSTSGVEFDPALLQFDWSPGSSVVNRLPRQSPVEQHTPLTLSANHGAALVGLENDRDWTDTAFVYLNEFGEGMLNSEEVGVGNIQSLYLPTFEPDTLALDGDQAAMVAFFGHSSGNSMPGLFLFDRSAGESQFNLAYTLFNNAYTVSQVDISRGRIALTRRGKVQLMTMLSDGLLQYNQSIAPVDADAGYFETALTDNTLLAAASTVYQWEESSLNRRFADIWQQTEVGEWQFLQRFEYQEGSHASFAKQVYLSNDSAVVMSLRLEDGGFPNGFDNQVYEPDYHIYTRQSDGRWRFHKLIHHTSGFAMNCADCDFYSDIRWPVQLFGKYLFLPVRTETGLHYQVHDTSTESVGVIASSIPGDTSVDASINSVSEQGSDDDGVEQTQSSGVELSNDEQSQAADESDADVTAGTEVDGGSTSGGGGFGLLLMGVAVFGGLRRVAGKRSGVRYLH